MKRKSLAFLLSIAIVISMIPTVSFGTTFSDIPNDWSKEALESAVSNGLLTGYNGELMPKDNLTRAQMATIINRSFGATGKSSLAGFSDVESSAWYFEDMAKAIQMKTFVGNGDKLNPDNDISREEAFVVLARAFKLSGAAEGALNKFSDKALVSQWAKDGVASLTLAGYVSGSNGLLNPKNNITRAEFAQIMYNLLKNYINIPGTYSKVKDGNVIISVPDVTIKDTTVKGDLIIGDGVGEGDVTLDNVNVTGRMVVRGGGVNSIIIIGNSKVDKLVISKVNGNVRVIADDTSKVEVIYIDDGKDDVIVEGNIGSIEVSVSDVQIIIQNSSVENLTLTVPDTNVSITKGTTVNTLSIPKESKNTNVSVAGTVTTITTEAADSKISVSGTVTNVTVGKSAKGASITANIGATITNVKTEALSTTISGAGKVVNATILGDNSKIDSVGTKIEVGINVKGTTSGDKSVAGGTTSTTQLGGGTTLPVTTAPAGGGGGGSSGGGTGVTPPIIVPVGAISETVTIGINEEYNLVENLAISTSDATVTFASNDATGVYSNLVAGKLTGIKQGRVTITAEVSKTGYVSKTVSFEVLIAPVLLSWTDPSGEKEVGNEQIIKVNISLLAGVESINDVDIIMKWEKIVNSDWLVINPNDITLMDANGVPKVIENGFYRLAEDLRLGRITSITSSVTFNNAGEYKLTVYAIKE